jgi:hypothetical protein
VLRSDKAHLEDKLVEPEEDLHPRDASRKNADDKQGPQ